jgi:nitric oxide reductase subunit B
LWVALVVRALWPVLQEKGSKSLIYLVLVSALAIGLLYGAGLMWGQHTNIAVMEYWRWWVVHLWVEGIFEVFATAIISLLFVRMGILRTSTATVMVLFATIIFLFGGVLGTFHHLYFSGTPTSVIAIGAMASALEVVPLLVVGFEAYTRRKVEHEAQWQQTCHWPFMFFTAVLFRNLVGAGLFGFLINPPIALYYMQGLNTNANHGHAALFGVYGMLGLEVWGSEVRILSSRPIFFFFAAPIHLAAKHFPTCANLVIRTASFAPKERYQWHYSTP